MIRVVELFAGQCANISAHTYDENNERLPTKVFGLNLQNHLGNRSPSVAFLNLVRARSIPCDRLANSVDSTIFSKNSIFSGEMVTFKDTLFCLTIFNKGLCEDLNIDKGNLPLTTKIVVGGSNNGKHKVFSERAESKGGSNDSSGTERSGTERTDRCYGERSLPFGKGTSMILGGRY